VLAVTSWSWDSRVDRKAKRLFAADLFFEKFQIDQ